MDWQVIILTLGTAIITMVGNIIITSLSIRKIKVEQKIEYEKEFMSKRMRSYDQICSALSELEENLMQNKDKRKVLLDQLHSTWTENFHYCSMEINRQLFVLFRFDLQKGEDILNRSFNFIREQMKKELDKYFNNKEITKMGRKNY